MIDVISFAFVESDMLEDVFGDDCFSPYNKYRAFLKS